MFVVHVVNTEVIANFLILLVLNFQDHRPDSLRVIYFKVYCQVLLMLCADGNGCIV